MTQVSARLASLSPSATLAMSQKSSELKAQGVDVINLLPNLLRKLLKKLSTKTILVILPLLVIRPCVMPSLPS